MSIIVIFIVLFLLFLLNVPIAWSLGISATVALVLFSEVPLTVIPQRLFTGTDSFTLIAIPFFLLAGELMAKAGISDKLIAFAESLVGHIRGGLGGVAVGSTMMFSAVSGSGIAATAAMGKITIPAMLKRGYSAPYAVAIQSTSGAMGIIVPPSIVMIVYSVIANVSVADLFMGGIIPGFLMGLSLITVGYVVSRRRNYQVEPRVPASRIPIRFLQSVPALLMPAIILAGILLGIVTATESAVLAVIYAVIVGLLNRKLSWDGMIEALRSTVLSSAMIMLIVANASVFAWVVTSERLPQILAGQLQGVVTTPLTLLLIFGVVLLIVGMFLDTAAALIIMAPVMLPLAQIAGVDPVHFGVFVVVALAIGLATPPVGLNVFVAASIAKVDVATASRDLIPFVGALVAVLAIIGLVPETVLWLPGLFE